MKFSDFTLSATPAGNVFIVGYSADGTVNLRLTAASLPVSAAQTAAFVGLTGNQTVAGVKTFSSVPVVPGVQFSTTSIPASAYAQIRWNDTDKCPEFETDGGVMVQLGQETLIYARNVSGVNEPNGAVVMLTGSSGQRATVALAQANAVASAQGTIGVVTTDAGIANNGFGFVTTQGLVRGLDTSAFTEGAEVWLSAASAGVFTATKPSAEGQYVVRVGFVVRSHATQGSIFVQPLYHGSVTGDAVASAVSKSAARAAIDAVGRTQVTSNSFTAIPYNYHSTARFAGTINDPESPAVESWYIVDVTAGTSTIGGVAYPAPAIVRRSWTGFGWETVRIATPAGTLAITTGKTFTATGTLTIAGTDGSTLNIGAGGTLGAAAFAGLGGETLTNAAQVGQMVGLGRRNFSQIFCDFVSNFTFPSDGYWGNAATANGGAMTQLSDTNGAGVANLSTGASSASGRSAFDGWSNGTAAYTTGDGEIYMEWRVRIPTLSDGTDTFTVTIAGAAGASATPLNGIFMRYTHGENSGNWTLVCRVSGSETSATTGVAVAANTWVRVGIRVNAAGTSVQAVIDDVNSGTPITTNIPTQFTRFGGGIFKSVGTAARTLEVDYTYYRKTFTTPR